MRYFLKLAYKGTNYHGWQMQKNANTVQLEIQKALEILLKKKVETLGCGRTDTGVHAKDFYLHFDVENKLDEKALVYKLNGVLPDDIACFELIPVENTAHTRFDALSRTYHYEINTIKDPFQREYSMFFPYDLDIALMNKACDYLLVQKDFAAFCKAGSDQKTTLCDLFIANWSQKGTTYHFEVKANRFLRNMVRALVGTLLDLGRGKISLEQFMKIVDGKDRKQAGASADAKGLYLVHIEYPYFQA